MVAIPTTTALCLDSCSLAFTTLFSFQLSCCLQHVDISRNLISSDGKIAIGRALCSSKSPLRSFVCDEWTVARDAIELDLSAKGLQFEDAVLLSGVLATHGSLQVVNLDDNFLGDGSVDIVVSLSKSNGSLTSLSLNRTSMSNSTAQLILKTMQAKPGLQVR